MKYSSNSARQSDTAKKPKRRGLLIAGIVLAVIVLLVVLAVAYYNSKLDLIQYDDGKREIDTSVSLPIEDDEIGMQDLPEAPDDAEERGTMQEGDVFSDSDVVNILLLGTDERTADFNENARADSIMVLSLNKRLHTIKLVSIERGIGVPVPGRNDDWITHTFRYGGADLTMQTVRDCFKVDVERYVRINFNFMSQAIDAIGGVDITLSQAEADVINRSAISNAGIQQVFAGTQHVNGETALCYSRIRKIDSDWQRIKRQRKVIQAAVDQVKNASLLEINDLADTVLPMVQTNLTKSEITSLLLEAPGFLANGQIEDMTIPTDDTCWNTVGVDGRKLIGVDFAANAEILKQFFYEGELEE